MTINTRRFQKSLPGGRISSAHTTPGERRPLSTAALCVQVLLQSDEQGEGPPLGNRQTGREGRVGRPTFIQGGGGNWRATRTGPWPGQKRVPREAVGKHGQERPVPPTVDELGFLPHFFLNYFPSEES